MFTDLLLLTGFHQERRNQSQAGSLVRENPNHPGAPADLFVDPLEAVGGADQPPVLAREIEHRETLCQVLLHPGRQSGR